MRIQAKDVKLGQDIAVSGVRGKVIDIKESFLKNGKKVCVFRLDCPARNAKLGRSFANKTIAVPARIASVDCKATTFVNLY